MFKKNENQCNLDNTYTDKQELSNLPNDIILDHLSIKYIDSSIIPTED